MSQKQPAKPLSTKAIEAMKPNSKDRSDTGENTGLRVFCGATGIKTFFYRYSSPVTHKLVQLKIGNFPQTSLSEARVKLQELKQLRQLGRCPVTELKEEKQYKKQEQLQPQKTQLTVKELVELYLVDRIEDRKGKDGKIISGSRKKKGQKEVRRMLEADVVRVLGELMAHEVTRKNVIELVREIDGRGAKVQAGNVLRELSAAYEFAIGLDYFDDNFANPALLAKASLQQANFKLTSNKGTRYLDDNELKKFLAWLPSSAYTNVVKNVFRLTLWTGCRTGEVCAMAWDDVDLEKGTVHLRETKTGIERHVQLPDQAVTYLKSMRMNSDKYLFPSQVTKLPIQQKYLTECAWRLRKEGKMLDITDWSPHDLRRTVRTGLAKLGCPNEVAEAILGHIRGGIEGTYNLYGYENECKVWLQKWADHMGCLATH